MVPLLSLVLADAEEAVLRLIETRFADGFRLQLRLSNSGWRSRDGSASGNWKPNWPIGTRTALPSHRRFPPPWSVEELDAFIASDEAMAQAATDERRAD